MSLRPVAIGAKAHAAVMRADGVGRVLARLTGATYLTVGGEIVWLAGAGAILHPRAILVARTPRPPSERIRLEVGALTPWRPPTAALERATRGALAAGWRGLDIASLGTPGGFGPLLAGASPVFPLDGAREAAEALGEACAHDAPAAAVAAALALLGRGGGLTPSGDDFIGGALFVRALLAAARPDDARAWRCAAGAVLAAASTRTHPISAALLTDLVEGSGWAPLHELVGALAGAAPGAADAAARRLVRLGHTSGWDMLAGVGAGLGALAR